MKQIFWKTKTFLKKLECRVLAESTKIENASFPFKTATSEANVKTNRMVKQNRSIAKNGVLPETSSFFWKFCFSLRTSYKELIWCTNDPNAHIRTFCKRWSFIWRCFFHVSILKSFSWKLRFELCKILHPTNGNAFWCMIYFNWSSYSPI